MGELHDACRSGGAATATVGTVTMPAALWTLLRIRAATGDCSHSSTFPLRESTLRFAASELLGSAAEQQRGGFLLPLPLPVALTEDILLTVDANAACQLAAGASSPPPPPASAEPSIAGIRHALCGDRRGDSNMNFTAPASASLWSINDATAVLSVTRRCADAHNNAPTTAAAWSAVRDTLSLEGEPSPPHAKRIACNVAMSLPDLLAALTWNLNARIDAAPPAMLHHASRFAFALRNQFPSPHEDPRLPILHGNGAALAEAAEAGDVAAFRELLDPSGSRRHLPGWLAAFNMMVSPLGVLQSLAPVLQPRAASTTARDDTGSNYSALLELLFEPEPPQFRRSPQQQAAYLEAALGGAAPLSDLTRKFPNVRYTEYWPWYAPSGHLRELGVPHSRTFTVCNTPTPHDDDVAAPHAAITEWDRALPGGNAATIPVYEELLVLTPAADTYFWFTSEVVGRLQLLRAYIDATPGLRVHVPYYYVQRWMGAGGHHGGRWLEALGLRGRIVSGRAIARVVHVMDDGIVGPRCHPLQLAAVRDAMARVYPPLHHQGEGAGAPPLSNKDVLVVKRTEGRRQQSENDFIKLTKQLAKGGLTVHVYDGSASLADTFKLWSSVGAVVAPHGAGLTNLLAMRPGATLLELLPAGHAAAGLYYMNAAAAAGVHYHQVLVPGTLHQEIKGGVDLQLWVACNTLSACNASRTLEILPPDPRMTIPLLTEQQRPSECIPGPRPAPAPPLTAHEPTIALVPFSGRNITTPYGVVLQAWISPAHRLPLAQVRAIGLIHGTADNGPEYASRMSFMRGLIYAMERRKILPVALPIGYREPREYHDFADNCTHNRDVLGAVGFASAVMAAVRSAQGLPPDAPIPVVSYGLSSGATFTGILGSYLNLDAAVTSLDSPLTFQERLVPAGNGTLIPPGDACFAALGAVASPGDREGGGPLLARHLRSRGVPPLWQAASAVNIFDLRYAGRHRARLLAAGVAPTRFVQSQWIPRAVCPDFLHEDAPWLLSPAASRLFVDLLRTVGMLVQSPEMDAALASIVPAPGAGDGAGGSCASASDMPPAQPACLDADGAPMRQLHLARLTIPADANVGGNCEAALQAFRTAVAFIPGPRRPGEPMFFAAAGGDPALPSGARPRRLHHLIVADCAAADATEKEYWETAQGRQECAAAVAEWWWVERWARITIMSLSALHEYHYEPWEDMAAWMASWAFGRGPGAAAVRATSA